MTYKELNVWFWNKFESCYSVIDKNKPDTIYLFYDKSYIRKNKIRSINKQQIKKPNKVDGICLFELNIKVKNIYCNTEIFEYFEKNTDSQNVVLYITKIIEYSGKLFSYHLNVDTIGPDIKIHKLDKICKYSLCWGVPPEQYYYDKLEIL